MALQKKTEAHLKGTERKKASSNLVKDITLHASCGQLLIVGINHGHPRLKSRPRTLLLCSCLILSRVLHKVQPGGAKTPSTAPQRVSSPPILAKPLPLEHTGQIDCPFVGRVFQIQRNSSRLDNKQVCPHTGLVSLMQPPSFRLADI